MLTHCNTLRCPTARACRSYIARARDRFSGGHGPLNGALGRPAERPGKSLAGVAAKISIKWKLNICLNEFYFIYTSLPFRTVYKAVPVDVPPYGGTVRITVPHHIIPCRMVRNGIFFQL